ncbi:MAG: diguanylate cyclase, partial [Pseudobdellovibrio sp.]
VMPKLSSLKYLNYFESGSRAGDEMLEAVSEVLKNNMRSSDLTFKLNGADFLWSLNKASAADLLKVEQKLNAELLQNPKVKQILLNEQNAISAKIAEASKARNSALVLKLNEKLESVKNFKPDLNFRAMTRQEAQAAGSFQNILKKFDEKFK